MSIKLSPNDSRRKLLSLNQLLAPQAINSQENLMKTSLIQPFKQKVTKNPRYFHTSNQKGATIDKEKASEENAKMKQTQNGIFEDNVRIHSKLSDNDKSATLFFKTDVHYTPAITFISKEPLKIMPPRKLEPLSHQDAARRNSLTDQEIGRIRDTQESESPDKSHKDFEELVSKSKRQEAKIKELEDQLVIEKNEKQTLEQNFADMKSHISKLSDELDREKDKNKELQKELNKVRENIKNFENYKDLKVTSSLAISNHMDLFKRKTTKIVGFEKVNEDPMSKIMKKDMKKYGIVTAFIRKLMIFLKSHRRNASEFISSLDSESKNLLTYEEFQSAVQKSGFRSALNELQAVFNLLKVGEKISIKSLHSQLQSAIDKESEYSSDISSPPSLMASSQHSFASMPIIIPDSKLQEFLEKFPSIFNIDPESLKEICKKIFPEEVRFEHIIKLFLSEEIHIEDIELRKKLASYLIGGKEIALKKEIISNIIEKLFGEKEGTLEFQGELTEPIIAQIEYKREEFLENCRGKDSQKSGVLSYDEIMNILGDLNVKITENNIEQFKAELSANFGTIDRIVYENLLKVEQNSYNRGLTFAK
ncbi:unnamed protein product [Blepharisma stoltei]|uniref:EF-hand domain-containing protein n=1 Tax=Blepharisma stoltei TaxID=1481888 RepID=A0AAU9IYA2_9CILI|nr:unnamed protein product [Blepharisma stoltei]